VPLAAGAAAAPSPLVDVVAVAGRKILSMIELKILIDVSLFHAFL
jgi:Holliday junction resolvase